LIFSTLTNIPIKHVVKFNIGGTIVCTKVETILQNEPESIFTPMLSGNFQVEKDDSGCI